MTIVKLMGGLGNQMFQYAVGRRISLLRNTTLKADVTFLHDKKYSHTSRGFELNVFSFDIPIATQAELNKFTIVQRSKLKRGIQRIFLFIFPYQTISEPSHEFSAEIINSTKNSLLIGYWQTEKYFLPIQDVIRNDFIFERPLDGLNKSLLGEITSCNSVSMHIRRGDYVHHPETSRFHGSLPFEYYTAALELMKSKIENIHLYIFSDDIIWVKANMNFDIPATYVDNNTGDTAYIDMQLMSLCKHNIIANSSFSWWGAWLNNYANKIVVAPAKWFADSSINVNDVIPAEWHKL